MSEQPVDAPATDAPTDTDPADAPKPTETVDFWKQKAREQEKRAKENATAAQRLKEYEDSQKTEAQKAADRIAALEQETAAVPSRVASALRDSLISLGVVPESRKVLLTASDPESLIEQIKAIQELDSDRKKQGNHAPREGNKPRPGGPASSWDSVLSELDRQRQ